MRRLVACPSCRRQADAGDLAPGSTLACACGQAVRVPEARPQAAAVVRCSSCGAARVGPGAACTYCGSDWTLAEQDLHTLCPQCMTRISDRAHFCHACGIPIAPQAPGAADPARPCPTCGDVPLRPRVLPEAPPLMECERCGGLWTEPGPLQRLLQRAGSGAARTAAALLGPGARHVAVQGAAGPGAAATEPARARLYLACPACGTRMNRKRFPGRLPLVVDVCRDHGFWFEPGELPRLLEGVAQGLARPDAADPQAGPDEAQRAAALLALEQAAEDRARTRRADDLLGVLEGLARFVLRRW
ncbi:MAG: zf-TFIIB domain-containing protein [Planctomycetia bacterium]